MAIIDRIKYDGPPPGPAGEQTPWLIYKFPSESLVLSSQLIVNQSQEAIFFKEGVACDVFGPGRHTLSTYNLPILKKFVNLPFGGETPFTAEVYFVNKVAKLDMKWGTAEPLSLEDPKYNIIVRVRGYGQFGIRISDSRNFVRQIIGALHGNQFSDYPIISNYFRGLIQEKVKETLADIVVNKKISIFDILVDLKSTAGICQFKITDEFNKYGIEVLNFFIESINFPDDDVAELKEILIEKARIGLLGDKYIISRVLDVLDKAASGKGASDMISAGIGLGAGVVGGSVAGNALVDLIKQIKTTPSDTSIEQKIKCPKCEIDNLKGSNFCNNCGTSLQKNLCPNCNFENLPNANFCSECGSKLK